MYELEIRPGGGFALRLEGKLILLHTPEHPAVFLGRGNESISMFRGNFDIRDRLQERIALQPLGCADGVLRLGHPALAGEYRLRFAERDARLEIDGECGDASWNRLWLRLYAEEKEHVVGGGESVYTLFTAGILVPLSALMVPYFVIINKLGLYNTYGGMILLYSAIGIPMSTFLIRGLMDSIPMDLEEAAYIDGCGFYGRFFHIILPLSRTGIVTAATFQFLTCWNEFIFANLIVSSEKLRTIQVGIRYFTNQFSTDYVSMYAAIVISIVPSIVGYVLFQEQIIAGMTSGAVKG